MTILQLVEKIYGRHSELSRRDIKGVLDSLATIGYKELQTVGVFLVPGC
jgi:DNA-binding protein HU-beta